MRKQPKLTIVSALHYLKLVYRGILLLAALVLYITGRVKDSGTELKMAPIEYVVLAAIWIIYAVEMALRFFPSKYESIGNQKQFRKNYLPVENAELPAKPKHGVLAVIISWVLLNGAIGALYFTHIIDKSILLLISLTYGVSDIICILFFCPFQTWFMKNRCCAVCRIYNWDFAMMFTPFVFIPHWYTWSLLSMSMALIIRWEITAHRHPERFSDATNESLSCANCNEKLCHHKKQLRKLWKDINIKLEKEIQANLERFKK